MTTVNYILNKNNTYENYRNKIVGSDWFSFCDILQVLLWGLAGATGLLFVVSFIFGSNVDNYRLAWASSIAAMAAYGFHKVVKKMVDRLDSFRLTEDEFLKYRSPVLSEISVLVKPFERDDEIQVLLNKLLLAKRSDQFVKVLKEIAEKIDVNNRDIVEQHKLEMEKEKFFGIKDNKNNSLFSSKI